MPDQSLDKEIFNTKSSQKGINRRSFIGGMTALGVSGIASSFTLPVKVSFLPLQEANHKVIRNGYVLTMDAQRGNLPRGDVLISGGKITAVGEKLEVPAGTEEVNAENMMVLPGFVETHWHIWNSLMRSLIGSKPGVGYFEMKDLIGQHFRPQDTYAATRFAVAEALNSGITTLHDWNHNVRGPEYAEASLRALKELGIRGRFSQGQAAAGEPYVDLELLEHLHQHWADYSNEGLLKLGLASARITDDDPKRKKEVIKARELGLPVSVHADTLSGFEDLLGNDFQIIHAMEMDKKAFEKMAKTGASVSFSPFSEMRIGFGLPPVVDALNSGVSIGLSVDTTPLSGNADMFALMKVFLNLTNGMAQDEFKVSARSVLEIATNEGARSLGMENVCGSLTPGKRADVIMVSVKDINMGVLTDPENLLVLSAQPANVDSVLVDGKFRKRNGQLVGINQEEIISEARGSLNYLLKKSGW
ncbi:amidohydrolase family protein [Catalinimonas niigatensis]|uniref:amidohydrolase family protein n=1 Tax=Catalinimonas niigatensis TaxID=1397264 RepID=UPI002666286E|nr:amidohydrolase family protein [Catalinimonas niigatensis]WPP52673.1 amidohydrolase family protein [Catalinimonas niigatensis]